MAVNNPIFLIFDRQASALTGWNGSASSIPKLIQGDVRDLRIQIVDPSAATFTTAPYQVFNAGDVGFAGYVTLSATPKGDGTQTVFAGPLLLTWDPVNKWFVGSLDLTGANIAAAIGSGEGTTATFQFELKANSAPQTIFQQDGNSIVAPANPGAVTNPAQASLYSTTAEIAAKYVPILGGAGAGLYLTSPDGTK